jgi:hypothetical protein
MQGAEAFRYSAGFNTTSATRIGLGWFYSVAPSRILRSRDLPAYVNKTMDNTSRKP